MNCNSNNITSKKVFQEAVKLSFPLVISQFLFMSSGFISNLMLSRVSENAFAAGLFINVIQIILVTVIFGLLSSLSPLIGKVIGQKQQLEHVGQLFISGCIISFLLCIPIICTLYFIEPIMLAIGQPPSLAQQCALYFHIYLWSIPAAGLISVFIQLLLGTFKQIIVFAYSIGNLFLSSILSYILIFGKLGSPALGLEGLAWAVSISSWLAVILLGTFILRHPDYRDNKLLNLKNKNIRKQMASITKLGLPVSIHIGNEMFSFLFVITMVGWISIEALNMQQIVTRYLLMFAIPIYGLSQAITVSISKQFGAKNISEIQSIGQAYIKIGIIYSVFLLVVFTTIPDTLISLFIENKSENTNMYYTLSIILILVAVGQIFDSIKNIITGALRGLHDTKFPMKVSIIIAWPIGVPLAYLMGFTYNGGLIGITLAHIITIALVCICLYLRWIKLCRNMTSFIGFQEAKEM
ncbi:MATE family efflux transporter [Shewanella sp. VB17]|uniref:MATE family efflux transporter n=1 Tax=Shewanella sp. VB17 TaxID=2739432 RepID=UPI001564E6F2|nr:MATE family efflux transporter [Shewanella sp. VB17]NRD72199.1 MATE family efflux transporter [Shewanella sp. VB17]